MHAQILGDNPAVSEGPPLGIEWRAFERSRIRDLDEYETSRPPRRDMSSLIMSRTIRVGMLLEEGYRHSELAEVEHEIEAIKKHRQSNARKGLWERVREVFLCPRRQ
jgi:hypothetical protein